MNALKEQQSLSAVQKYISDSPPLIRHAIRDVASQSFQEIQDLEELANRQKQDNIHFTKEEAERIKAIWVFSGPGTYLEPFKEDRYSSFAWSKWMDRQRLNHGALIAKKIAETLVGEEVRGHPSQIKYLKDKARKFIAGYGPMIIYNGTSKENLTVNTVMNSYDVIIPWQKLYLIEDGSTNNSVHQIKSFKLPDNLELKPGDRIALVSHAPHLMRVMHMIDRYRNEMQIPDGVEFQLFPLPSPKEGKKEYQAKEIRGLLYYALVSGDASLKAYLYII
jgi:hypothetical protein